VCVDSAHQNQEQSHGEMTNPNHRDATEIVRMNGKAVKIFLINDQEWKRNIDRAYKDQCINTTPIR